MARSKTAWKFNPAADSVAAALSAGSIEALTADKDGDTFTVRIGGKGPAGRDVPVVKYRVVSLAGAAAALGNEDRILRAVNEYINRSVALQTKEANIGPDRKLMKLAKDMAALVGGDVDTIFANLKAQHAASHPA